MQRDSEFIGDHCPGDDLRLCHPQNPLAPLAGDLLGLSVGGRLQRPSANVHHRQRRSVRTVRRELCAQKLLAEFAAVRCGDGRNMARWPLAARGQNPTASDRADGPCRRGIELMKRELWTILIGVLALLAGTASLLSRLKNNQRLGKPGVKVVAQKVYDAEGRL